MIPAGRGTVVLCDANVLYGSLLRDLLVRLGVSGALRPRWTTRIEQEWVGNLLEHRPDLSRTRIERTCALMRRAIPEGQVEAGDDPSVGALPDPDDRHVLAAALACGAEVLLTFNEEDFPAALVPAPLIVCHPDRFLIRCLQVQPGEVVAAARGILRTLNNPQLTPDEFADGLARAGLPGLAEALQPLL